MLDAYDTTMLDEPHDVDVQMQPTSGDVWFQTEDKMEDDGHFVVDEMFTDEQVIEVEMEQFLDGEEYEMTDDEITFQNSFSEEKIVEMDAPVPPTDDIQGVDEGIVSEFQLLHPDHPFDTSAYTSPLDVPVPITGTGTEEVVEFTLGEDANENDILQTETIELFHPVEDGQLISQPITALSTPHLQQNIPPVEHEASDEANQASVSHAAAIDQTAALYVFEETDQALVTPAPTDEPQTILDRTEDTQARPLTPPPDGPSHDAPGTSTPDAPAIHEHTDIPNAAEDAAVQADSASQDKDPHEISDGVYIDPPPAVLLLLGADDSHVFLFNQPPSGTSGDGEAPVLFEDMPTLYYEPLSAVFDALRRDAILTQLPHAQESELVLEVFELDLVISEDNMHARDVTLHDLNLLYDGFRLGGSLGLRLRFDSHRFITKYQALQERLAALDVAHVQQGNVDENERHGHPEGPDLETPDHTDAPVDSNDHQEDLGHPSEEAETYPEEEYPPLPDEDDTTFGEDEVEGKQVNITEEHDHDNSEPFEQFPEETVVDGQNETGDPDANTYQDRVEASTVELKDGDERADDSTESPKIKSPPVESETPTKTDAVVQPNTTTTLDDSHSHHSGEEVPDTGKNPQAESHATTYESGSNVNDISGHYDDLEEWDDTLDGEGELDPLVSINENDAQSVESSVTLSSGGYKRSLHDMDPDIDADEFTEPSSPGSKRPRVG